MLNGDMKCFNEKGEKLEDYEFKDNKIIGKTVERDYSYTEAK